MREWRTDERKAADEKARPWMLLHASLFIGLWSLGALFSFYDLVRSWLG